MTDPVAGGRIRGLDDEATTARLLRLAPLREAAPADREARVRRAVLDECRTVARARHMRRTATALAGVLATAAAVFLFVRWPPARDAIPSATVTIATIERIDGAGSQARRRDEAGRATDLAPAAALAAGDRIETSASGRVALRLAGGASVRLDRGTTARFMTGGAIELDAGALYVDGGRDSADLQIRTRFGVVRDVGTQFEVRLAPGSMRVRVRSGLVEVQRGARVSAARPGTELTIDDAGITLRDVPPFGPEWRWAESLAAPFPIEGRPLSAFLEHVCREQGWTLAYEEPALARESSGIILHGSIDGLDPVQAVAVATATAGLAHRLHAGELQIRRTAPR